MASFPSRRFCEWIGMANFKGHALPGSFFILFGFWWSLKYPLKYHCRKLNKNVNGNRGFENVEVIEGAIKVVFSIIGKAKMVMSQVSAWVPLFYCSSLFFKFI